MVGLYEKDNARNRTALTKFTYSLNIGHHNIFKVSISAAESFGDVKILQKDSGFISLRGDGSILGCRNQ